jgi:hypothetical protein
MSMKLFHMRWVMDAPSPSLYPLGANYGLRCRPRRLPPHP